jgi:hypothetical protein
MNSQYTISISISLKIVCSETILKLTQHLKKNMGKLIHEGKVIKILTNFKNEHFRVSRQAKQ